jgi:hypothetical protein
LAVRRSARPCRVGFAPGETSTRKQMIEFAAVGVFENASHPLSPTNDGCATSRSFFARCGIPQNCILSVDRDPNALGPIAVVPHLAKGSRIVFRHSCYASRPIRSKKAAFAGDFNLPPVRNFSASEVCVDSMGSPRGTLARNQETCDTERTLLWRLVAFFSLA